MITLCFNGIGGLAEELASSSQHLPIWGLRAPVRELVEAVTEGYNTQRDFALMSLFSAVGSKCATTFSRFGSYCNYPTFYIVLVGKSSSGKTAPLDFFFKPIEKEESRAFELYQMEKMAFEATPKKERGTPPIFRHRLLNDASDESVLKELSRNESICWCCDELRTMFEGWGRYSANGSGGVIVGHLLSIFNHKSITITRAGDEANRIEKPLLNIIGGIQPRTLVRTIGGKGYTEDGLFQRFLFVYPPKKPISLVSEKNISDGMRLEWDSLLADIDDFRLEEIKENEEARQLHLHILTRWEKRCREVYAGNDAVEALMGKFAIHLCSISIAVALINEESEITAENIRYSAFLCEALFKHSLKVLRLIDTPKKEELTKKEDVAKAIRRINPEASASAIGKILGVTRQAVSKQLKS